MLAKQGWKKDCNRNLGCAHTVPYLHDEYQCREENDNVRELEGIEAYGAAHTPELQREENSQADESHDHQLWRLPTATGRAQKVEERGGGGGYTR